MQPIELVARRRNLGLSQAELAKLLGFHQSVLAKWENGSRAVTNDIAVHLALCDLEETLDNLIDEISETILHASAVRNERSVHVIAYQSDEEFWAGDARARALKLPAAMHQIAVARAVVLVREEGEVDAAIIAPGTA